MRYVPLAEVCQIFMGQAPDGASYNEQGNGYPLIAGAGDFGDRTPKPKKFTTQPTRISNTDDIILCIRATIGDINWSDKAYCLGRGVAGLRPKSNELDRFYLWHFINTNKDMLASLGTGSTFKQISRDDIETFEIPLPPLDEQRHIAAILDKADAIRQKRQESIRLTEEFLQSTFLEMFGDPATNPKGWDVGCLGDVIFSAKDGPHVSPEYANNGIPFLSTRHIKPGHIEWSDLKYISKEDALKYWKRCKPINGDILYTKGGTTGIAAVYDSPVEIAIWVHIALLKLNYRRVNSYWLETLLNSDYCYRQSQKYTHGITNQDLGLTRMVKIKLYIPSLEQQNKFSALVQRTKRMTMEHVNFVGNSDKLFKSIIQLSFRGEIL